MNANSCLVSFGHWLTVADDIVNSDFVMFIYILVDFLNDMYNKYV